MRPDDRPEGLYYFVLAGVLLFSGVSFAQAPRAADGHPDLTGVWQGGSTTPGNWDEANGGTGVGGTGRNPSANSHWGFSSGPISQENRS